MSQIINIAKAVELIKNEDVVGMPTETVYGLAGSINSEIAINKIFSTKERPFFDPLIVHVSSIDMAKKLTTNWNATADILAKAFWPGPVTLVMPKTDAVSDLITSGLPSVGIRFPNHKVAQELIEKSRCGLAAPSANKFKKTSPTSALHVEDEFGDKVKILDGGDCEIGIESTVLGIIDDKTVEIYRPGMVTLEKIKNLFKEKSLDVQVSYKQSPVAPGQLEHHYMPKTPVALTSKLGLNTDQLSKIKDAKVQVNEVAVWNLSSDAAIVARELYAKLRELDKEKPDLIQIIISEAFLLDENWKGILNRLTKASSFKFI